MAMELAVTIGKNSYRIDPAEGMDISIPVRFDENGLTAFGAEKASSTAYQAEGFTGAVEKGGSCNCGLYHFSPHLHGTHTECVGHLSKNALHITDRLPQAFVTATLITVTPETEEGDRVITKQSLESALKEAAYDFMDALVIRTLPNDAEKKSRDYDGKEMPPYFTGEAMAFIVLAGFGIYWLIYPRLTGWMMVVRSPITVCSGMCRRVPGKFQRGWHRTIP